MVQGRETIANWGWGLSGIVFLAVFVIGFVTNGPSAVFPTALAGAGAGLIVLGSSWILLTIVASIYGTTVPRVVRAVRGCIDGATQFLTRNKRRRLAELQAVEQRRLQEVENRRREQAITKNEEAACLKSVQQKRRERARAACELLYALHAAEIGVRYPRAEFDAYLQKYMSDAQDPAYVEERAEELKGIIEQQVGKVEPAARRMSLKDLATWYETMRQEIDGSPLPSRQKNVQLAQLSNRYQELVQEVLEEMTP